MHFALAWNSLRNQAARSLLMLLGVVIGVAAVIAMIAVGNGANAQVEARIKSLGSNLVFISPVPGEGGALYLSDAAEVTKLVPLIDQAMPVVSTSGPIVAQGQNQVVPIQGVTPAYVTLRDAPVTRGRFISTADVTQHAHVADIGADVAQTFFGGLDPLGRQIRVDGQTMSVIGVMAPKGFSLGINEDNVVFVPITTAQDLIGTNQISAIDAHVRHAADAPFVVDELSRIYTFRYHGNDQAIVVSSQDQLLQTVSNTRATFTFLLGGAAAISLVVGGIGIMNLMLVSVSERTREIGIRKAVGARLSDILYQFLIEALLLGAAGGLLGVAAGIAAAHAIARLSHWKALIVPGSLLLAFSFSLAIGVGFGAYPAYRAARLDPIEALRRE